MRIITAPEDISTNTEEISVFLAGGIQNTEDWQKQVIKALEQDFKDLPIVLYNPRRENFPIHDKGAAKVQITWEYEALEVADIFSMYYAGNTISAQPICMFEYGKHLERRYANNDLNRLVVSAEPSYSRFQDVIIQTALVSKNIKVGTTLSEHINSLKLAIRESLIAKRLV